MKRDQEKRREEGSIDGEGGRGGGSLRGENY